MDLCLTVHAHICVPEGEYMVRLYMYSPSACMFMPPYICRHVCIDVYAYV